MSEPLFNFNNPTQLAALMTATEAVFAPIREQERASLRERAWQLKQTDGEGWAIGEMVERACIVLDAIERE